MPPRPHAPVLDTWRETDKPRVLRLFRSNLEHHPWIDVLLHLAGMQPQSRQEPGKVRGQCAALVTRRRGGIPDRSDRARLVECNRTRSER